VTWFALCRPRPITDIAQTDNESVIRTAAGTGGPAAAKAVDDARLHFIKKGAGSGSEERRTG
jgi:hypothetical protein